MTPSLRLFIPEGMDNRTPRNTTSTQNHAADKKRAEALRQNLLKRKQQSRARTENPPPETSPKEK